MKTKTGDFIEIDYVGRTNGHIFDVTSESQARKHNVHNPKNKYNPVIICLGQHDILQGLDRQLTNKELGKTNNIKIEPEQGFGKRNPKLLKLIKTSMLTEHNINPMPGLQVNMDGVIGIIKTVSGGRTIIDFNHPLAGKTLDYEVTINRKVTNSKEKVQSILKLIGKDNKVEIKEKTAIISGELDRSIQGKLGKEIKKRIPEITKIEFSKPKSKKS